MIERFIKEETDFGFEGVWADNEKYSGRVLIIKKGESTPYIYNEGRDKTIVVLQGIVGVNIDGTNRVMKEGDVLRIGPKVMNRLVALKGDATIIECGTKIEQDIVVEE